MATSVKVPFTTGNFDLIVEATLKDEAVSKFVQNGFNWVVQRDGATKAYLTLAGEENEKGKVKLPADFKRKSITWSPEKGEEMVKAMQSALQPYCETVTVSASEHVEGETVSPMVRATNFVDELLASDEGKGVLNQLVKFSGASASNRDEYIKVAHEKGWGKSK